MDALHNRVIAGFLCLLIIITSSVLGVVSTLMPMRAQVIELFHIGERRTPGIVSDLNEISAQAFNLTVIARRYIAPGDFEYYNITWVLHARDDLAAAMQGSFSPREIRDAHDNLISMAHVLNFELSRMELSDQDQNLMAAIMAEISSRMSLISQSPYNQAAFNFNQSLSRFPANILGRPFARPLELFE